MDGARFDALLRRLDRSGRRRLLLTLLGSATLGAAPALASVKAKAKGKGKGKKKGKKKGQTCQTVGGAAKCPKPYICCDPVASTVRGCAEAGNPVCCGSSLLAYPAGTTCCATATEGNAGVCQSPAYPHCCQAAIGGCCEAGYPLCCAHPTDDPYCCPAGSTCCPEEPTGCCSATSRSQERGTPAGSRGGWQAPGHGEPGTPLGNEA